MLAQDPTFGNQEDDELQPQEKEGEEEVGLHKSQELDDDAQQEIIENIEKTMIQEESQIGIQPLEDEAQEEPKEEELEKEELGIGGNQEQKEEVKDK